jgi:hypothetical protein
LAEGEETEMKGIAATSWSPQRLDVFCLKTDFSMAHGAYDPTPLTGVPDSSLPTTIAIDELGGAFTSVPAAVLSMARPPVVATGSASAGSAGVPPARIHPGEPIPPPSDPAGVAAGTAHYRVQPPVPMEPRIDVFALDSDYAMRHLELWNGNVPSPQPQWGDLGGIFISTPAAVAWEDRVDVFGVGLDRAMYRKTLRQNAWSNEWEPLGGTFTSEASAVSWGPGRLDVFARGSDFTLRHKFYDGTTVSDWENFGGSLASPPTAVSWGENRLDVFALADDGRLAHKWWDGILWNEWEYLGLQAPGTSFVATPSAVSWGRERLDIFVSADDGAVYHFWFAADTLQGPESLGNLNIPPVAPTFTPSPTAISVAPNQLSLFAPGDQVDSEGSIIAPYMGYRIWDGSLWREWTSFGEYGLPSRYKFSVDFFTVETARSLDQDTDTVQSTLKVGNLATQTAAQYMGNWGGTAPKQAQVQLVNFAPVTVELCEYAIFNYQIVNSAEADQNVLDSALNKAGKSLASYAISSIMKALGQGLAAITSIEVGTITSVPVIGTILGLLSSWVLEQLASTFSAGRCDGTVALEQVVLSGRDLHLATAAQGIYTNTTDHPGTDSPAFCGSNSDYSVTWSIRRI